MDARSRRHGLLGLFGVTIPLALLAARSADGSATSVAQGDLERGRALFERNCVVCHGPLGRGDGSFAYLLDPAPRDLGSGRFRLISTVNGVPTQGDLIASIRNGMPGSAMPPWEWLGDDDLAQTALYVRHLAREGQVADLLRQAEEDQEDLSREEALSIVEGLMIPGAAIEVGPAAGDDPLTLQTGRQLYAEFCASCHGEDGTGSGAVNVAGELRNEDGTPNSARDFTAGIFKGGSTHADLMRRILAGLPGSPMPATSFESPEQAAALVAFVRSLVKPGAQERVVQRRRSVPVARVPGQVPIDPADPAWSRSEGAWIALMPLWWRDQRVEGVVVRAVHDGETLALHLSWADPTRDEDVLGARAFSDAAALQVSTEKDPPLFAMGMAEHPVDVVLWRAAWQADALASRDVGERWPGMEDSGFSELVGDLREQSLTARAVGNSQAVPARPSGVEALTAQGLGTLAPRMGTPSSWKARGSWVLGDWRVVFTRPLRAPSQGEPALSPGQSAFLAFAVWDGAFADRNGQKSVSVWHRLEIAP